MSACFVINIQLKLSKQKTSEDEVVQIIRLGGSLYGPQCYSDFISITEGNTYPQGVKHCPDEGRGTGGKQKKVGEKTHQKNQTKETSKFFPK
ncbi:hypothetical protein EK904_011042 [Melospiza melodia maxima]|nr:hypothetical protein EK904_011042 [Melospiza melodia maxima]